ncbi:MAG: STAS domain-containing protein [Pseudomonadota bacterium]
MQNLIAISPVLGALDGDENRPARPARPAPPMHRTKAGAHYDRDDEPQAGAYMGGASSSGSPCKTPDTLTLTTTLHGQTVVVAPCGVIDAHTVEGFQLHLFDALNLRSKRVVIDLAQVGVMSSRGLRAVTLAQRAGRAYDTQIVLACPTPAMREVLAISRYDMVFEVADTVEDATGH